MMAITKSAKSMAIAVAGFAFAHSANAATLAAGPMFGGPSMNYAVCYVINTGSTTVAFSSKTIRGQNGNALSLIGDTCGSGLASQASCYVAADINSSQAFSCELTTGSKDTALRGEFELRDTNGSILNSTPLR